MMHKQFMLSALHEAWQGRGFCAPNPSVGALVVHDGKVMAKDWHRGAGTAHAEQRVLQQLAQPLDDMTLYVTLEPCNHWGKTPPCVSAIIDAGVKRVVFGFRDPNPIVFSNDTPSILAKQGIEVVHFPLPEIDAFYQSYDHWTQTKKPWVTAKLAQSLDGKIAGPGKEPVLLSNEACSLFTHEQRWHTDIILTTSETIQCDNPRLNARCGDKIFSKPVAIIDRQLSLTKNARIFSTANHCFVFHDANVPVKTRMDKCEYYPVKTENGRIDLEEVISLLGELGYHDVWVEAGGQLFSALHEQGLVQTTYLYLVPKLLGDEAVKAYHNTEIFNRAHRITWQAEKDNMVARIDW